jgi:hypothetical protein
MSLALHVEPDANFGNQRRLVAYAPILQPVMGRPARPRFFASPNGTVRSFLSTRMIVRNVLRKRPLIAGWDDENERSDSRTRVSGPSREFAEKRLQHATAAAEVTRDRNQKAESAEKEGRNKFWVREVKDDGFRLMVRPAALSTR